MTVSGVSQVGGLQTLTLSAGTITKFTSFGLPWTPPNPAWGKLLPDLSAALFTATNTFRMAHGGEAPYVPDPLLQKSIEWKVLHLAGGQYLAHDDPLKSIGDEKVCPRGWYDRICATGYDGGHPGFQGAAAENLLYGNSDPGSGYDPSTPVVTAQRFIDSFTSAGPGEGHYDNIVANFGAPPAMGVAVAIAPNGYVFAGQDFGTTSGQVTPPPPVVPPVKQPIVGKHYINMHGVTVLVDSVSNGRVFYHVVRTGKRTSKPVAAFNIAFSPT